MADVTYIPENQGNNNILPWMLAGGGWNNGGIFGGQGLSAFIGGALGALFPNLIGWNNGGFNGLGGNGAGFISNQLNNDSGRELLMNAITSQGEASRTATQSLSTMLGQDFNLVNAGIQAVQTVLSNMATQQAVSVPQIINAIQAGDASLAASLCECCCNMKQLVTSQGYENQLRTVEQTNTLGSAIAASGQRTVDAIADLKTTMVQEFCAVKEREMQAEINKQGDIITQLRNEADNARQTNAIAAMLSPLAREIDDIKCKLPNTVAVQYPNLQVYSTTPNVNPFYGAGAGYGFGYGVPGGSYWG